MFYFNFRSLHFVMSKYFTNFRDIVFLSSHILKKSFKHLRNLATRKRVSMAKQLPMLDMFIQHR